MIKACVFMLLCTANSLFSAEKHLTIKPSFEDPILLKIARLHKINETAITYYAQLIVDQTHIIKISKNSCLFPTQRYRAKLYDGRIIDCTYYPLTECAGEIWASCTYIHDSLKLKLPIDQKNFFILKSYYEKQTKS